MGIRNRDGSLYMVTGIDNSGLYEGKREAMGIIKTLAGEITSFDVFGGIGISAATAFAKAAKSSYDFEKEFRKNMLSCCKRMRSLTRMMRCCITASCLPTPKDTVLRLLRRFIV